MQRNSLLLELLVSGFFAIACLKARAGGSVSTAMKPRDLLRLTPRLERLRQTRWQWFAMVLIIAVVRVQRGLPLVVEMTAALQFVVFLMLPAQKLSAIRATSIAPGRPRSMMKRPVRSSKVA